MTGSIVLNVCAECGVSAEDFFGKRNTRKIVHARRLAIFRLRQADFSYRAIGRLIRRDYSTVRYWVCDGYRERRVKYMNNYHAKHKPGITRDCSSEALGERA